VRRGIGRFLEEPAVVARWTAHPILSRYAFEEVLEARQAMTDRNGGRENLDEDVC
jgi:hypothetical protein